MFVFNRLYWYLKNKKKFVQLESSKKYYIIAKYYVIHWHKKPSFYIYLYINFFIEKYENSLTNISSGKKWIFSFYVALQRIYLPVELLEIYVLQMFGRSLHKHCLLTQLVSGSLWTNPFTKNCHSNENYPLTSCNLETVIYCTFNPISLGITLFHFLFEKVVSNVEY